MKKWVFVLLAFPLFLFGESSVEYYIGEMKSQIFDTEEPEHYGFVFLKRTFLPEENCFQDHCLITSRDKETVELTQISNLNGDLHAIQLSGDDGMISGEGKLIGYPWKWTQLQEKMRLSIESPIEIEVKNKIEEETMQSVARVFTLESDGSREFFGKFTTELYRIDIAMVEKFFYR